MAKIIHKSIKKSAPFLEEVLVEKARQKLETKLEHPGMYRVVMLNDDYTPMDFVVVVLEVFFAFPLEQAIQLMLDVHRKGRALCGVFPKDIAETKALQVNEFSTLNGHPLLCRTEKNMN